LSTLSINSIFKRKEHAMNCTPAIAVALLAIAASALADSGTVTFFSDGALVEIEARAVRGTCQFPLPDALLENSLRIKPLANSYLQRVDILPVGPDRKGQLELDKLLEQKSLLEDRLQALATREEIFKAAARSQSGKAPRRTKTNPDPLQSIRTGTDFAMAQLEAVYTARRKTGRELRRIDDRIARIRQGNGGAATVARVRVSPPNGRVRARFAVAGQGWSPRYDIRLKGDGRADLTLYGLLPPLFKGYRAQAARGRLSDSL
jgi:hypothetical protein